MKFAIATLSIALIVGLGWAVSTPDQITEILNFQPKELHSTRLRGYDVITLRGCDVSREIGHPQLPLKILYISLPPGATIASVQVEEVQKVKLPGKYMVYPSQPSVPIGKPSLPWVEPNPLIYQSSKPFPEKHLVYVSSGSLAGYNIAGFLIYPVQYIPSEGTLFLVTQIKFSVQFEITASKPIVEKRSSTARKIYQDIVKNMVLNPEDVAKNSPEVIQESTDFDHVIITDDAYRDNFQPLADWNSLKGLPDTIVSIQDIYAQFSGWDTPEKIRNFIIYAYQNWGIQWVLLGGDTDVVPVRISPDVSSHGGMYVDDIPTDLYYSDLDGSWDLDGDHRYGEIEDSIDMYADVFVGRAPVNNGAEADLFVSKIMTYEKNPPATHYGSKALFLAYDLNTSGLCYSDIYDSIDVWYFPPRFDPITKDYDANGRWGRQYAIPDLNAGPNIVIHSDHSNWDCMGVSYSWHDELIYNSDVDALYNGTKQSVLYSIGCHTTEIDHSADCIAEHFMRNPNGGAVAFIGNTRYGFYQPDYPLLGESSLFVVHFFESLFAEGFSRIGQILADSKHYYVATALYQDTTCYRWLEYCILLLGEPSMYILTNDPDSMEVSYPDAINPGPQEFAVTVMSDGSPIEDALVCVRKPGEVYEYGLTDATGTAILEITPLTPDSMSVTVTAQNQFPHLGNVQIVSEGAYVLHLRHTLVDTIDGNGDGIANPGETLQMQVWVKNWGNQDAFEVSSTLRTDDSLCTVLDSIQLFGDIPAGDSAFTEEGFEFEIDPGCPNAYDIHFQLRCTDTFDTSWVSNLHLMVEAPEIVYLDALVHDEGSEEPNGMLDPGETVELVVGLKNRGYAPVDSVQAILSSSSGFITISDWLGTFDHIGSDSVVWNDEDRFSLTASENTPWGHEIPLNLQISGSRGYSTDLHFSLIAGKGGDFLIWDLDRNRSSGSVIRDCLENKGYNGYYTDATTLDEYRDILSHFSCIFICLGVYPQNWVLSEDPDITALCEYLDAGGRIYLEGGDTWAFDPNVSLHSYFGFDGLEDGEADTGPIEGCSGTFTQEMHFEYGGDNNWMDRLGDLGPHAFVIFKNANPFYNNGVANIEGNYRTVGTSFELGGLLDLDPPSTKLVLLDSIMHFFGINMNLPPQPFDLVAPPDQDTVALPVLLDWEDSSDPEQDPVHYTLLVSLSSSFDPDSTLIIDGLSESEYLLVDGLPEIYPTSISVHRTDALSLGEKDLAGAHSHTAYIQDGVEYYWKVIASDTRGGETASNQTFRFFIFPESETEFIRGDADSNMLVEMPDAVYILRHKFIPGSPPPSCLDAGDTDDNGLVEMPDAVYILRYKFIPGSPPPPPPFPGCGADPTGDEIGCEFHPCMETPLQSERMGIEKKGILRGVVE